MLPRLARSAPSEGVLLGQPREKKARQDSAGLYSHMHQKPAQDGRFIWQLVGVLAT